MDLKLTGRRALVTGASAGIGRAVALSLASEGVALALAGRSESALASLRAEIAERGAPKPAVVVGDLAQPDGAAQVANATRKELGDVDILVNNAGGSRPMTDDGDEAVWQESMALNFTAARRLAHAFVPAMQANRYGRIINITGSPLIKGINAATAAKAALQSWAKGLAVKTAAHGVTVNCVGPGRIKSVQIMTKLHPTEESRTRFIEQHIPAGRFGEAEEFAPLVTFLASPMASYITGVTIYIDGGMTRTAL